jgi:hypothetical protein
MLFTLAFCFVSGAFADDKARITQDEVQVARTKTHYDLYYANKALRTLTYLDEPYDHLNDTFNRAARAWYKGQYHMDLVTSGEIAQGPEAQRYFQKALTYFKEASSLANKVSQALQRP